MTKSVHAKFHDPVHRERFVNLKEDSQDRMGTSELTNGAFVAMLLDVWEHHLDGSPESIKFNINIEYKDEVTKQDIVRDTGVGLNEVR